tara:strand:- start:1747 stop:2868 length:1122 start_codon:yes stop_codon:yes gene_type:complete
MEELDLINGNRPSEIHTIIVWDGKNNSEKAQEYMNNLSLKNIKILYNSKITLSKQQEYALSKSIYNNSRFSKVKNSTIHLFILQDTKPIYSFEKATTCWQVLNKTMKTLKEDMRLKIGGSLRSTGSIHGSYNPEEAFCVLKPLNLMKYTQRKTFQDFNDFFTHINKHNKLKYTILRSFQEIENLPEWFITKTNDIDILVNDYYYFKSLTGARSRNKFYMRERDNGYSIQSLISIGGVEIPFDIRFVGDNYVDSNWEKNILNHRIKTQLKTGVVIYTPNYRDELYSLIYHILIQKYNPETNKHINRVQYLQRLLKISVSNFKNLFSERKKLDVFMQKNKYIYKKPYDRGVKFLINTGLQESNRNNIIKKLGKMW